MTRPYAEVIGDPIAHSKSPLIHNFWLEKLSIDAEYRAMRVDRGTLGTYLEARRNDSSWRGCNVTMPLKSEIPRNVIIDDELVRRVGASNLVTPDKKRRLQATNSDVQGILSALPTDMMPPGSEVCLIGTGGAARAALMAMHLRGVSLVLITARDHQTGFGLLKEFRFGGCVHSFEDPHNVQTADVIINSTPLGMVGYPPMSEIFLNHFDDTLESAVVFDMITHPVDTDLIQRAKSNGLRTVDGLEMLIAQAAPAFEKFFGQLAPREHDAELRERLIA